MENLILITAGLIAGLGILVASELLARLLGWE
jgi:hypothetical protein